MNEKKNNIVYILTAGSYSDYHICGVADNLERAKQLQKYYSKYEHGEDVEIEEYLLNEVTDNLNDLVPVYLVTIDHNGKCNVYLHHYDHPNTLDLMCKLNTNDISEFRLAYDCMEYLNFSMWVIADNEEKALKIAQDKRAEMIYQYAMDNPEKYKTNKRTQDYYKMIMDNMKKSGLLIHERRMK